MILVFEGLQCKRRKAGRKMLAGRQLSNPGMGQSDSKHWNRHFGPAQEASSVVFLFLFSYEYIALKKGNENVSWLVNSHLPLVDFALFFIFILALYFQEGQENTCFENHIIMILQL